MGRTVTIFVWDIRGQKESSKLGMNVEEVAGNDLLTRS